MRQQGFVMNTNERILDGLAFEFVVLPYFPPFLCFFLTELSASIRHFVGWAGSDGRLCICANRV